MSEIIPAQRHDAEEVCSIVRSTILQVYPHWYSQKIVDQFIEWNSMQSILSDIDRGGVWLIRCGESAVGTVTVRSDLLSRLYVLPLYQGRGFGSSLLAFAESRIAQLYRKAWLEASAPSEQFYLHRGYEYVRERSLPVGDNVLVWYEMTRSLQ